MSARVLPVECDNTVEFCCSVVVPEGFEVIQNAMVSVGLDTSCLECVVDQCTTVGTVTNPCDSQDTFTCDVDLDVIKAIGCIRLYVALPIMNATNNTTTSVCCSSNVCVNNKLCVACEEDNQACPDFDTGTTVVVDSVDDITPNQDDCGETIVQISGTITLPSCP
jgi:hypothetical protein